MDTETGPTWPHKSQQYDMNGKIMLGAVISLSVVIILVLILHIYARCAMTRRHGGAAATVHHLPLQHRHVDIHHQSNNAGLELDVIASLPLFVVVKDQGGGGDCAVCLSDLEEGEEARRLPNCKHRFHVECIDRWLSNQPNCPICRTEVTPWAAVVDEVATVGPPTEEEGCSDSVQGSSIKELNGSSSSSRLSSFRRIISGDWSSRRIQQIGVHDVVQDLERQS